MALLGVAVFSALFTMLMTWWYEPVERASVGLGIGPYFSFAGFLPFTFTLWAMSLAVAGGVLGRRVRVAALAALVGFLVTPVPLVAAVAVTLTDGTVDSFWLYQAIEASVFLGASAALLALTVWVVSRRMR
jgi:hypothetical protein